MTMMEIVLALDDDIEKPRVPGGGEKQSREEILQWAETYRNMTPQERLQWARERW